MPPSWPLWRRADVAGLARFVDAEVTAAVVAASWPAPTDGVAAGRAGLPSPDGADPAVKAAEVFAVLAAIGPRYLHEPAGVPDGYQLVRPAHEVINPAGGGGTCLDLSVTYAALCAWAGLDPWLVLLDGPEPGALGHALVVLAAYPQTSMVTPEAVVALLVAAGSVTTDPGATVGWLAVDPTVACSHRPAGLGTTGPGTVGAALEAGRGHLARKGWSVRGACRAMGVPQQARHRPTAEPALAVLSSPYQDQAAAPDLRTVDAVQAGYRLVRFRRRPELETLLAWALEPMDPGAAGQVAILDGPGGAGKTRLAAEWCQQLHEQHGWRTGFGTVDERRHLGESQSAWLQGLSTPVGVVLDYADASAATVTDLARALAARPRWAPWRLLLTTRDSAAIDPLADAARAGGLFGEPERLPLAAQFPQPAQLWRTALDAFADGQRPPLPPGEWTALEVVLHAWLHGLMHRMADHGPDGAETVPRDRAGLYDRVVRHEISYWTRVGRDLGHATQTHDTWRQVGAHLSLLGPSASTADRRLEILLATEAATAPAGGRGLPLVPDRPDQVADVLRRCAGASGRVAVRPDPIADHVIATTMRAGSPWWEPLVMAADRSEAVNLIDGVHRAGDLGPDVAVDLAVRALAIRPALWKQAWGRARTTAGPWAAALAAVIEGEGVDPPAELVEAAMRIPLGHANLRGVALAAARRFHNDRADAPTDVRADCLNTLAARLSEAGERQEALVAITEAVTLYRALTTADPGAFTPNLARSLRVLSPLLEDTGRASREWEDAIAALGGPFGRALLLSEYVRWLGAEKRPTDASAALARLAQMEATAEPDAKAAVRRALHAAARWLTEQGHPLSDGLPWWAVRRIDEAASETVGRWLGVAATAAETPFLRDRLDDLAPAGSLDTATRLLEALNPGHDGLTRALAILDRLAVDASATLADLQHENAIGDDVRAWLATPTWPASRAYLDDSWASLGDPIASQLLRGASAGGDREAARHLAILELVAEGMPTDEIFDLVEDLPVATEWALAAVDEGDLERLFTAFLVQPGIAATPVYGPLLVAVVELIAQEGSALENLAGQINLDATSLQRREAAARLRRAAGHWPQQAAQLTALADLVEAGPARE